jgi:hypothetical protein
LDLEGIGARPHEGLDLQVLLQGLEEELDLPAVLVDGGDRRGPEGQVVRQEDQRLVLVRVIHLDPPQVVGALLRRANARQTHDLVPLHAALRGNPTVLDPA